MSFDNVNLSTNSYHFLKCYSIEDGSLNLSFLNRLGMSAMQIYKAEKELYDNNLIGRTKKLTERGLKLLCHLKS